MRRLALLLAVAPALAQEDGGAGGRLERLHMARIALDARLKLADMLVEDGKREEARAAYARAIAIFEAALDTGPPQAPAGALVFAGRPRRPFGAPDAGKPVRDPAGGAPRGAEAVDLALRWLADHQDADGNGRFDAKGFMKHDPADDKCDGPGNTHYDVGLTGLAMLAFLGGGYTDRGDARENPYAKNVRMGLRFLMESQDEKGCFGARTTHAFLYNHAIATLATCEALALTGNPRYRKPAQDGIAFILEAQNPGAGWRYEPRGGESDTSLTAWCIAALRSARHCGIDVPDAAFDGAVAWVDKMTDASGRVGYNLPGGVSARYEAVAKRFPPEKGEAMTAAGAWIRLLAGHDPGASEPIRAATRLCAAKLPRWNPDDGSIDMYYWHFGTLALFQAGGAEWRAWSAALEDAVVAHQHPAGSGARSGSWDPIDAWGLTEGGRIYSTALLAICLEVQYRYERGFGVRAAGGAR